MELNKTMEIGFSNLFYNDIPKIFPGPIFPVGEPDGKICDKSTPWTTSNVQDLIAKAIAIKLKNLVNSHGGVVVARSPRPQKRLGINGS